MSNRNLPSTVLLKSRRRSIIIILALIIILIVSIALVSQPIRQVMTWISTGGSMTSTVTPKDLDNLINDATAVTNGSTIPIVTTNGIGGQTSGVGRVYSTMPLKETGTNYFILPSTSKGVAIRSDSTTAKANFQSLKDFLVSVGLSHEYDDEDITQDNGKDGESTTVIAQSAYKSKDFLCMVQHIDLVDHTSTSHVASLGCATKASYDVASEPLGHFYDAYVKTTKDPSDAIVLGLEDSKDGSNGYSYATLYQEDPKSSNTSFTGYYYKNAGDDTWYYLRSYAQTPSCSDFDNQTLKFAFTGLPCSDTTGQPSSVQ